METSCEAARKREPSAAALMCLACCPPSERHWFKWVLLAQPVIAVVLLSLAYFELL
ncbi:MAG: hypothetical protein ACK40O_07565 [Allosphingosinicella sp.]